MPIHCPLCKKHTIESKPTSNPTGLRVNCEWCGLYWMHTTLVDGFKKTYAGKAWKVSAYIREKTSQGFDTILYPAQKDISADAPSGSIALDQLIEVFPNSVAERLDRVLLNLERTARYLGEEIRLEKDARALVFAQNYEEMIFIVRQLFDLGYLTAEMTSHSIEVTLTGKGLMRAADLKRGVFGPLSKQSFIAMSFDRTLSEAWLQGLKLGIEDCGYTALRVDGKEHNDKICDVIIAEIRKSKFLVADFTLHRAGVYFEAGLMMGLGRPVIFTCRSDELSKAHFDTRQYNHIGWDSPTDLREKLKRRIQATIPP